MTHAELVIKALRWLRTRDYHATLAEPTAVAGHEIPDAIGWKDTGTSCLIECKTSRADFFHDQEKRIRGRKAEDQLGNERWFLTPRKLVLRSEVPPGWGLVEVTEQKAYVNLTAPHHRVKAVRLEMALLATCLGRLQTDRFAEAFGVPEAWALGKHWAQLQIKDDAGLEIDLVAEVTELGLTGFGDNEVYRRNAVAEAIRRKVAAMSEAIFHNRSGLRDNGPLPDLLHIAATLNRTAREIAQRAKRR